MAVPAFHAFLHPLLEVLADGQEHRVSYPYETVENRMGLTAEDRAEVLPSGKQRRHAYIGWAKTCLAKDGLVGAPRRGYARITMRGQQALASSQAVDLEYLHQCPEFRTFRYSLSEEEGAPCGPSLTTVLASEKAVKTPHKPLYDLVHSVSKEFALKLLD